MRQLHDSQELRDFLTELGFPCVDGIDSLAVSRHDGGEKLCLTASYLPFHVTLDPDQEWRLDQLIGGLRASQTGET